MRNKWFDVPLSTRSMNSVLTVVVVFALAAGCLGRANAVTDRAASAGRGFDSGESLTVMIDVYTAIGTRRNGAGLLVGADDANIFIVTAAHVLSPKGVDVANIEVRFRTSPDSTFTGHAVDVQFHADLDLALLRVVRDASTPDIDTATEYPFARLTSAPEIGESAHLVGQTAGRSWSGSENPGQVGEIYTSEISVVASGGPGLSGGSALDASGRVFGIVLSDNGVIIKVLPLPLIIEQLRDAGYTTVLAQGPSRPKAIDVDDALARLEIAKTSRSGANHGQGGAMERLVSAGYDFVGENLSGITLSDVDLAKADFADAELNLVNFDGANLVSANFTGATLKFATAVRSDLSHADFRDTFATFMDARHATFNYATFSDANFFGADLRGADFVGANLSGAGFAFADMRGADLRGANLARAHFVGALLEGAKFDDADFKDTNMLASLLESGTLTESQRRGTCRAAFSGNSLGAFDVRLAERRTSDKDKSGYAFDEITQYMNRALEPKALTDKSLPICKEQRDNFNGYYPNSPTLLLTYLDADYLRARGRREAVKEVIRAFHIRTHDAHADGVHFIGSGAEQKDWLQYMQAQITPTELENPPHVTSDMMLMLMLKHNVIGPGRVDWSQMAKQRLRTERTVAREAPESIERHLAWPPFFPAGSLSSDLPDEAPALFEQWALSRAATLPDRIVVKRSVTIKVGEQSQLILPKYSKINTIEGVSMSASWPTSTQSQVRKLLGGTERVLFAPVRLHSVGIGAVLLALPEPLNRYVMRLSPELVDEMSGKNPELELHLEIKSLRRLSGYQPAVLIDVEPIAGELFLEGERIHSGKLVGRLP